MHFNPYLSFSAALFSCGPWLLQPGAAAPAQVPLVFKDDALDRFSGKADFLSNHLCPDRLQLGRSD